MATKHTASGGKPPRSVTVSGLYDPRGASISTFSAWMPMTTPSATMKAAMRGTSRGDELARHHVERGAVMSAVVPEPQPVRIGRAVEHRVVQADDAVVQLGHLGVSWLASAACTLPLYLPCVNH